MKKFGIIDLEEPTLTEIQVPRSGEEGVDLESDFDAISQTRTVAKYETPQFKEGGFIAAGAHYSVFITPDGAYASGTHQFWGANVSFVNISTRKGTLIKLDIPGLGPAWQITNVFAHGHIIVFLVTHRELTLKTRIFTVHEDTSNYMIHGQYDLNEIIIDGLSLNDEIADVAIGDEHIVFLVRDIPTRNTRVFGVGNYGMGDSFVRRESPIYLQELIISNLPPESKTTKVFADDRETFLLVTNLAGGTKLYVCDITDFVGRIDSVEIIIPGLSSDEIIETVAVGYGRLIALITNGGGETRLCGRGENYCGQLGAGSRAIRTSLQEMVIPSVIADDRIVAIAIGFRHTALLIKSLRTNMVRIHVAGNMDGHQYYGLENICSIENGTYWVGNAQEIIAVVAGFSTILFSVIDRTTVKSVGYGFGANIVGQLGISLDTHIITPMKIPGIELLTKSLIVEQQIDRENAVERVSYLTSEEGALSGYGGSLFTHIETHNGATRENVVGFTSVISTPL